MRFKNMECGDFVDVLASKNPVPGGGGASVLVAAIGMALGNMVGSLTIGKKKYASVQDDVISLMQRAEKLRAEFLELIQGDAEAFEPLSKAYGMPSNTQEEKERKEIVMEECLVTAGSLPLLIMKKCCESIEHPASRVSVNNKKVNSDHAPANVHDEYFDVQEITIPKGKGFVDIPLKVTAYNNEAKEYALTLGR